MLDQLKDLVSDRKSFLTNDSESNYPFQRDIYAIEKIMHDYKILRDAVFKSMEEKGENLCIWINENVNLRKVEILNIWKTDYDDVRCNAILYKGKRQVANIIISHDIRTVKNLVYNMYHKTKIDDKYINVPFKTLIYDSFDSYLKLPKISKCSKLLQEIYDNVCESEATICHITDEDWKEDYAERFTDKDIQILKEEIQKYGLEGVIGINDSEYKIVGYGDLETRFNDNRKLFKEKERLEK